VKIAVLGAAGFVGRAVVDALTPVGVDVQAVHAPRIRCTTNGDPAASVRTWRSAHAREYGVLTDALAGAEVVVNAAGLARPDSADAAALEGANAVLPGVVAWAACDAGARRLVHVSTAAVQGRRDPLDETEHYDATTPYARSKLLGERVLLDTDLSRPVETIVYRPTSVMGPTRAMTRSLVRLANRRVVPLFGDGAAPLPSALVQNVGAATVALATGASSGAIAVHPSEGMTARALLEAFGARRFLRVPRSLARIVDLALGRHGSRSARREAWARRLELLAFGQQVQAATLNRCGYRPVADASGYRKLAAAVRGT
jgi:nucleoside-diphosphate-sugar epimerase